MSDKEIPKGFYQQIKESDRGNYQSGYNFKGDWMKAILESMVSAMEERYANMTPKEREEEEIKENLRKLEYARRQQEAKIEYDAKYFTPEYDELFPGYVCEKQTSYGWINGSWPSVLQEDSHYNCDPTTRDDLVKLKMHSLHLRAEYLTTQMLVMEGWKRINQTFLTFNTPELAYTISVEKDQEVKLFVRIIMGEGITTAAKTIYTGRMKSINEYRKILKLAGIKL